MKKQHELTRCRSTRTRAHPQKINRDGAKFCRRNQDLCGVETSAHIVDDQPDLKARLSRLRVVIADMNRKNAEFWQRAQTNSDGGPTTSSRIGRNVSRIKRGAKK